MSTIDSAGARCGDGILQTDEGCDDGNSVSGDGCDENCTPTACGTASSPTARTVNQRLMRRGQCRADCFTNRAPVIDRVWLEPAELIGFGDGCDVSCSSYR